MTNKLKNRMRKYITIASFILLVLSCSKQEKYKPTYESLKQYKIPEWFKDAKFGIFIHWGVYAVPAHISEWYPRNMYKKGGTVYAWHREKYGPQKEFGYKDFIPMFKAEKWNPRDWVNLFKKAGAKYVVPVAEHHDGFAMYNSSLTKWNTVNMGPHRDVIGELAAETRRQGLYYGVSSHYAWNWEYYTFDDEFDTVDPENSGLYGTPHPPKTPESKEFLNLWYARTKEIIDRYSPDLLYFDFGFNKDTFEQRRIKLCAYYYNQAEKEHKEVVLTYKNDAFPDGTAVLDIERGRLKNIRKPAWQTDTSVGIRSWGYIPDEWYKPVNNLIDMFVDIVSKNGNLLLNVNPKADGTIPQETQNILLQMGEWLKLNGESIYGSRPWLIYGEGPTKMVESKRFTANDNTKYCAQDIRFTTRDANLYAIALGWPGKILTIKSVKPSGNAEITLLGYNKKLAWEYDKNSGLIIHLPQELQQEEKRPGKYAYVFKTQLDKIEYAK